MGPKRDAAISRQFRFVHHFCVSLDHFDFVLLVLLGLVFSVPSQEIGWENVSEMTYTYGDGDVILFHIYAS